MLKGVSNLLYLGSFKIIYFQIKFKDDFDQLEKLQ